MSHRTPATIRTLDYVADQSKGFPVGIPIRRSTAKRLVAAGLLEYAPCSYIHLIPKPVSSVRLTGAGAAHRKIYYDGQRDNHARCSQSQTCTGRSPYTA